MEAKENEGIEPSTKVLYTWKELLAMGITEVPALLQDCLPQQGIAFLTGPSDSGKSTWVRQLAYGVVQKNETFLGRKLNTRTGRALIICTEDDAFSIASIVRRQTGSSVSSDAMNRLHFIVTAQINLDRLDKFIEDVGGIDLAIMDVWTDTFKGDLNQTTDVRTNLAAYKKIAQKHGCLFLCLHHAKKGSEDSTPHKGQMLGSQGIEAVARVVLDFRKEGAVNNRLLSITKGNYIADAKKKPVLLTLNEETMLFDLVELPPAGWGWQKNSRTFTNDKEMFMETISDMHKKGHSMDKIVEALPGLFPDKKTPSKGTIHKWLQIFNKGSQSTNP